MTQPTRPPHWVITTENVGRKKAAMAWLKQIFQLPLPFATILAVAPSVLLGSPRDFPRWFALCLINLTALVFSVLVRDPLLALLGRKSSLSSLIRMLINLSLINTSR